SKQADSDSKLEQAIHQMFPAAVVTIGEERGRITVTGEVDSNDEAFKILALVRQVHLVPVIDRLTVR
ncbi:MAG: BON domain-containing protein, partial [Pirellulaceae bacterium]